MNIIKDVEQGTDEWHDMRIGHITASRFKDVLSKGRGTAPSKTRLTYMRELVAELISGEKQESFSNEYMEWGTATEPQARAMYEFDTGNAVTEIAFCKLDNLKIGCSPDGLVGDDGGLEIKCPKTTTHIETVLSEEMPSIHKAQVQGSMWVTGRKWWDFVSFDPRVDGDTSFFCKRVYRDDEFISDLEKACMQFSSELETMVKMLKNKD